MMSWYRPLLYEYFVAEKEKYGRKVELVLEVFS